MLKKPFYCCIILFTFVLFSTLGYSQPNLKPVLADSLWSAWKDTSLHDTSRLNALHQYHWDGYLYYKPDTALYYANIAYDYATEKELPKQRGNALYGIGSAYFIKGNQKQAFNYLNHSLKLRKQIDHKKGIANSLNVLGTISKSENKYEKAIEYYEKSIAVYEESNNLNGIATAYNNIGMIYSTQGKLDQSIEYYSKSLDIHEKMGDQKGYGIALNNIGIIYENQQQIDKALKRYEKCLEKFKAINFKNGVSSALDNIGSIYTAKEQYSKAIQYHKKSLAIDEDINNQKSSISSLQSLGRIYRIQNDLTLALDYYEQALKVSLSIGSKEKVAECHKGLGDVYKEKKQLHRAIKHYNKSLQIAQKINAVKTIQVSSEALWKAYKSTNNYEKALNMHETYIQARDSLQSKKNQRALISKEYEKKAQADSIKAAEKRKINNAKIKAQEAQLEQEQTQRYALYSGIGVLFLCGAFIFNRFRVTRKQNFIIEKQKQEVDQQKLVAEKQRDLVEEKNGEITDSIQYAQRLQEAILPNMQEIQEHFPSSFILFRPKDIVSGDFYWHETKGETTFIAAADCTGHGVPGAMVSVVCANALNKSVNELGLTDPAKILDSTRNLVVETFSKTGRQVKDGMDISLLSVTNSNRRERESESHSHSDSRTVLRWAGANNPLWIIRTCAEKDRSNDATEVEEIKADKQPIGLYGALKPFTSHEISLQTGDRIYLFSDGYADQFGGPKGKKMKKGKFKELLISIKNQSMREQQETLNKTFENWKGSHEQIDDVCIVGVKI